MNSPGQDQNPKTLAELQIRLFEDMADRIERIEKKVDQLIDERAKQGERLVRVETAAEVNDVKSIKADGKETREKLIILETRTGPLLAGAAIFVSTLIGWFLKGGQ